MSALRFSPSSYHSTQSSVCAPSGQSSAAVAVRILAAHDAASQPAGAQRWQSLKNIPQTERSEHAALRAPLRTVNCNANSLIHRLQRKLTDNQMRARNCHRQRQLSGCKQKKKRLETQRKKKQGRGKLTACGQYETMLVHVVTVEGRVYQNPARSVR